MRWDQHCRRSPALGRVGGGSQWLNVLSQHVAAPPPPVPRGRWGKLKAFFWHAMEIEGEAQLQQSQAELAMGEAIDQSVEKHIWLPVHDFLIRHKLLADGSRGRP